MPVSLAHRQAVDTASLPSAEPSDRKYSVLNRLQGPGAAIRKEDGVGQVDEVDGAGPRTACVVVSQWRLVLLMS